MGASALDLSAMLCAQPARSRRYKQKDAECDLGLEQQAISSFFEVLGRGSGGLKIRQQVGTQLVAAGVYRVFGSKYPAREWWLAYTGEGGKQPNFARAGRR